MTARLALKVTDGANRAFAIACGAIALSPLAAAPTPGQAGDSQSTRFASEALRICIDTSAEPAAIRRLATDENWVPTDPLALPAKTRIVLRGRKRKDDRVFNRTSAWTFEKDGLAVTVGLFDVPEATRGKKICELIAWDLDTVAVDQVLRSDPRLRNQSLPGMDQLRNYSVEGAPLWVTYIASDTGSKMLHVFSAQ